MNDLPIGTVLAHAGQINPVSGSANHNWANLPCGPKKPSAASPSTKALVIDVEQSGWMLCDGRALPAESYPELYAVLGTMYGTTGSSDKMTFNIPDYRGLFMRGFDAGAGLDPDAAKRSAPDGGSTANVVGSLECDSLEDHTHHYDVAQPAGPTSQGSAASTTTTSQASTSPDSPARTSTETRPKNVAVNYIIKFR